MLGQYGKLDLDRLWNLIKYKRTIFSGEYVGLVSVNFDIPLEEFAKRNLMKHKEILAAMDSQVLTDIPEAIDLLRSVNIRCHHLSCAADVGFGDNSALCIHYLNPSDNKFYALALPGVNYDLSSNSKARL